MWPLSQNCCQCQCGVALTLASDSFCMAVGRGLLGAKLGAKFQVLAETAERRGRVQGTTASGRPAARCVEGVGHTETSYHV
jgi:hypothetical protein